LKIRKKIRFKKRYWLLVDLAIVIIILILLLYKPARYNRPKAVHGRYESQYLTNVLSPQLYNGVQRQEPFELTVTQEGINDIIARSKWPKQSGGFRFSAPEVLFIPGRILLMGTIAVTGVELVVTVVGEPAIDENGFLNLRVTKLKIGAMNVTPIARVIAKRMYAQRLAAADIDTEDLGAKIVASLLNNEPFEPAFEIEGKRVRMEKMIIEQKKLTIHLVPAPRLSGRTVLSDIGGSEVINGR